MEKHGELPIRKERVSILQMRMQNALGRRPQFRLGAAAADFQNEKLIYILRKNTKLLLEAVFGCLAIDCLFVRNDPEKRESSMYSYKKLLVGISLQPQDGTTIRYAAMISRLAHSQQITFLHVADTLEVNEDICTLYPELQFSCDGSTTMEIEKLVKSYFDGHPETKLACEAVEGSPLLELLRRAKDEDIDLIVMRKRAGDTPSGRLSTKLARKAPCSLLFVPEGAKSWYTKIMVAVDFSENAKLAVEAAVDFAVANRIDEIQCLHVYSVPLGFYKTGKSFEQFAEIMKGHAEKNFEEFIEQIDLKGIAAVPRFRLQKKDYRGIWEEVLEEREVHLLVVGARGRRAGAGVLLGSVTEHLIRNTKVPLLAVKEKGTGMSLLDAVLKL
jgi:nucleotide-binding universal stress UspA family protein